MPEFSSQIISLFPKQIVLDPEGLLNGKVGATSDPLRLWIIQVGIIVCTASLLSLGLSKIRQPKVIAEVLGGILLGPTAFGRIPGFTDYVFPPSSRPYLSLVANIGLCLFLFLVGLEIDAGVIKRNARLSTIVALAGMILPFGIGSGLSHAIYRQFIDPNVNFTHFLLFSGVAYSITAFPVPCRILTELKLLDTTVGIVVLSAGVGNDIVGWVLLALCVALVNASSGLTALYILLACVGWTLFLLFPVKTALEWLARTTGSIQNGPSVFFMTVTMLILFGSAFFTDVIGVHAIFGAFVAGVIVPREGGLAITMTEKLEDMVSIIFLPLYFTLSGLSTDLGLLMTVRVKYYLGLHPGCHRHCVHWKIWGCTIAAYYIAGFNWRESSTIGSLMSCKGLVELIVLNVGLSAGILSPRVFSMFVLEALVLTFMTTPLVTFLYPPHLRRRSSDKGPDDDEATLQRPSPDQDGAFKTRFTVVLDKLEHLPSMMALLRLVKPIPTLITTQALRLIELSDRVSAVMKGSVPNSLLLTDPMLSIFRMFGQLSRINVSPSLSVATFDDLASSVVEHARNFESDMILLPWLPPIHDALRDHHLDHHSPPATPKDMSRGPSRERSRGPPQARFPLPPIMNVTSSSGHATPGGGSTSSSNSASVIHSQFVRGVFAKAKTDVALFVDQQTVDPASFSSALEAPIEGGGGLSNCTGNAEHVFLPFFGGPDDRLALEFVVQLCASPTMRGTVVRITKSEGVEIPGRTEDLDLLVHLGMNGEEGRN
ncbi:Sodium/hydrogen exchanger family-domain-containing protein, partial [Gymnopilus junonius]